MITKNYTKHELRLIIICSQIAMELLKEDNHLHKVVCETMMYELVALKGHCNERIWNNVDADLCLSKLEKLLSK